jgi:hypothetical protein
MKAYEGWVTARSHGKLLKTKPGTPILSSISRLNSLVSQLGIFRPPNRY